MRRKCMTVLVAVGFWILLTACGDVAVNGGTPGEMQNIPAAPATVTPLAGNVTPANILPTLTDTPANILPTATALAQSAAPAPTARPVTPPANGNGGNQACPTGHGGNGHDCRKDKGDGSDKSKGDNGSKKGG